MCLVSSRILRLRQRWHALLRAGSLVLILAFLPSVLYVGHWGQFTDVALGYTALEREADAHTSHEAHCHLGQSSCSSQPAPVGVQAIGSVVELPKPALFDFATTETLQIVSEFIVSPPTEPPRL